MEQYGQPFPRTFDVITACQECPLSHFHQTLSFEPAPYSVILFVFLFSSHCSTNSGSCPAWVYENLSASQPGYWTLTSSMDDNRYNNAIVVNNSGARSNAPINQAGYGMRPVIRLSSSNLRQS